MSAREVEDVLAGRQPDGRADLAPLADVAAVLHASREVEPAPPMSDDLLAEIDRGVRDPAGAGLGLGNGVARHSRRHRPRHLAVASSRAGVAAYRRPLVSVAAAAALLVGLVIVTSGTLPGGVDSAVSDMGSAIGLDVFRGDSATKDPVTTTSSTSTTTAPPATTAPPQTTTTAAPPQEQAPTGPIPGAGQDPSWWFSPEAWQLFEDYWADGDGGWGGGSGGDDRSRDGDRDGDGDGRGDGSGGDDDPYGSRTPEGTGSPDGDAGVPAPGSPTTMSPTSSSSSTTTSGSSSTTQ